MRNTGLFLIALALVAMPLANALPPVGVPDPGVLTAESALAKDYVVGFHTEVPRAVQPGEAYHGGDVLAVNAVLKFAIVRTENPVAFEVSVRDDDRVRYVEWDNPTYAIVNYVPNDAQYGNSGHYGSKKIGAEAAWDRTLGSTSVKVAVIDSGLRKTHEEFSGSGRVLQGYDWHNGDSDPNDDCGHGTHVAGTIAATINNGKGIAGLAQVTVLPIKGLGNSWLGCSGSNSGLANSLQYAADQGAHLSSNSWGGGGSSTTLNDAITYAYNAGVTQIAAAGNDGPCTNCVGQPWKDNPSKVIIVASTDSSDAQSSFSNEGPEIDVAAPGSSILSAYNSNDASYATLSGTSMATPHVTGAAALIKSLAPSYGYSDLDSRLKNTAVDLGSSGFDNKFGYGRVNADAATNGLGGGPTNQPPTASFTYSCTGLSCNFDGTGSTDSDGTIASYAWTFGDGGTATGATPGHTYASSGTYTVTLTVTDDDGATDGDSQSVSVSGGGGGGPTTVFSEDFDDGSAQGWTTNSGGTLWHMNTGCGTAHSPSYKLVWADSTSCTYNVGDTGADWAKTPAISLNGYTSATLTFWHWFENENYSGGAYDVLKVQRSCNDSSWTTLQQWDSRNSNVLSWTELTYDVSACAGGNVWIRWHADSIDGTYNNYDGWRVDDVSVTAS